MVTVCGHSLQNDGEAIKRVLLMWDSNAIMLQQVGTSEVTYHT